MAAWSTSQKPLYSLLQIEALEERQKENLFLDVRSQIEQLHDLRHTGSRHPAEAGQFRRRLS